MPVKIIFSFLIAFGLFNELQAQLGKRILNRTKNEVEYKVNKKVDEKVDKTIDKGINEVDTLLTGKKPKTTQKEPPKPPVDPQKPTTEKEKNTSVANQLNDNTTFTDPHTPNMYAQQMNTDWVSDVIFTNIKCSKGKQQVEKKLTGTKGIKSVSTNINTGELSVAYFPNQISYAGILDIISKLNFDADSKKAAAAVNSCQ